jgi:hypothetical protein
MQMGCQNLLRKRAQPRRKTLEIRAIVIAWLGLEPGKPSACAAIRKAKFRHDDNSDVFVLTGCRYMLQIEF